MLGARKRLFGWRMAFFAAQRYVLAGNFISSGVVVEGLSLEEGVGIMAGAAVLFGEFSVELADMHVLVAVDAKAATRMDEDKLPGWLWRFSRQHFAWRTDMAGVAGLYLEMIAVQFKPCFVVVKRLQHARGEGFGAVAVGAGG